MNVLVTGGAGYIGSHTVRELLRAKHQVVVYDSLITGHLEAIPDSVPLINESLRDQDVLAATMRAYDIDAVIHFAASSVVGESMKQPSSYYNNNVAGTMALLDTMRACGVKKMVFSSTAAVYGEPSVCPICENMPLTPSNVYGRTKLVVEGMLADFSKAYNNTYVSLRYFNAAGASLDGSIGEHHATETHLIPLIMQTALGQRDAIEIFGTNYPTPDGTCIRDYIHVIDLARAHVLALEYLGSGGSSQIYNLGSEHGFSVRQVIDRAKQITKVNYLVREAYQRPGDPAVLVASSAKIRKELGWRPQYSDIDTILATAWRWHYNHPYGYEEQAELKLLRSIS